LPRFCRFDEECGCKIKDIERHQEFLLDNLKWRWALSLEGELKMENCFIYDLRVFNEGDD